MHLTDGGIREKEKIDGITKEDYIVSVRQSEVPFSCAPTASASAQPGRSSVFHVNTA